MRSVNVADLQNDLASYLTYAKAGEVIIIEDHNRPIAKLTPFTREFTEEELAMEAEGIITLAKERLDLDLLFSMPRAKVEGNAATQALLDERAEGR